VSWTVAIIIAGVLALAGSLVMYFARRREALAKQSGRDEVIKQVQDEDIKATRRADAVLSERRSADDAARRLSDGSF
jgi:hypothetical protein